MNKEDKILLEEIVGEDPTKADSYNIRKNGKGVERKVNPYIDIVPKENNSGIDVYVKDDTLFGTINIPVIITESGLEDIVYNDFHIGKNANVIIIAGCGIHNDGHKDARHDGIHRFYLEEGSKVKYVERHCGEGVGQGSYMVMDTTQIKGVDDTIRITKATLEKDTTLVITEKILTSQNQKAITKFEVELNGENSSTHVTSRSVATNESYQEFISNITGNTKCYAHVECDAIIKENGKVKAVPEIYAKNIDANLIHEAAIGKIAGEQLIKLMSLGLTEKEAEDIIIKGFLK